MGDGTGRNERGKQGGADEVKRSHVWDLLDISKPEFNCPDNIIETALHRQVPKP
jgi:hypothetical protein